MLGLTWGLSVLLETAAFQFDPCNGMSQLGWSLRPIWGKELGLQLSFHAELSHADGKQLIWRMQT